MMRCRVCLAKAREQWRASHPLICAECRKLIDPKERRRGRNFHKLCSEKRKARWYPQRHLTAALAYQRRHRELGLCDRCPERVFRWGLCRIHYMIGQERYYD